MDLDHIAHAHLDLADVAQCLYLPALAYHLVDAHRTRLPTRHAKGRMHPPVGQHAGRHRFQKPHPPHPPVTACPATLAPRAAPNRVTLQTHRKAKLQDFRVGQARIGHVGLHHRRTRKPAGGLALRIPSHARPGATRDGFVILVGGVAESEVVHGGLAARHHAQSAKQRVRDATRRFHIARHHRGGGLGIEHAAFGNDHLQGFEATGVQRNVIVHQSSEHIQHRRHADGLGRIEVIALLRAGAGEIDHRRARVGIHPHRHLNLCAVIQRQGVGAVFQACDDAAHRFFGVVLHMAHIGLHHVQSELGHHLAQLLHAFFVGGDLRAQIGQVLLRVARGVFTALQQSQNLRFTEHTLVQQLEVLNLHAFFFNTGGERRHRAGRGAANVGMVTA